MFRCSTPTNFSADDFTCWMVARAEHGGRRNAGGGSRRPEEDLVEVRRNGAFEAVDQMLDLAELRGPVLKFPRIFWFKKQKT